MNDVETKPKEKGNIIEPSTKKSSKKMKKKKKSTKVKEEKPCKNLKELLDYINRKKSINIKKNKSPNKEGEEIVIKDSFKTYRKSTSGTTVDSSSQEGVDFYYVEPIHIELKPKYNFIFKTYYSLNEENLIEGKIKATSPMYEYYKGCDEILKKEFKEIIDLNKNKNFLKKSELINIVKETEIIEKIGVNTNNRQLKIENKFNNNFNIYTNNINSSNYNMDYNNSYDNNNNLNDIQRMIKNINTNINSNYFFYSYNKKNRNKKFNKSKKARLDWTCEYCLNLNYSFRKSCNRCNASKKG